MINTKVYTVLQHFSKIELNRCRKYICSPYFNQDETLLELFELITAEQQKKRKKEWTKAAIWKALKAKGKLDEVRLRKYFSDLLKLVEGFLIAEKFESEKLMQKVYLMQAVTEKQLDSIHKTAIRSARQAADKFPHRSSEFYLHQYSFERAYYDLVGYETKRGERTNIQEISDNLDIFYLSEKLKLLCNFSSIKNITSHEYDIKIGNEVLSLIQSNTFFSEVPAVSIYQKIFQMYNNPEKEEFYFELIDLLDQHYKQFPIEETKEDLYMAAQNYCIGKINQGNGKFVKELFVLYKKLVENHILIAENELSPWYFRNIVVVGLRLGEYEWIENFIKNYNQYLPEDGRENAVSFNLATLYFYQKKYEKVIELLRNVEYDDITYNLNSKTILLHTYYDTDETEPLFSLFESFRVYLNRNNSIPEPKKMDYKNLIKFTKKLTRILPRDKKALEKLKTDVNDTKRLASRNWLLEKITELE